MLIVTHEDFLDAKVLLHSIKLVKIAIGIQEEGDPDFFFDVTQETQQEQQDELLPAEMASEFSRENHGGTSDLLTVLSGVVDIDDDNDPAPENVLTMTTAPSVLSMFKRARLVHDTWVKNHMMRMEGQLGYCCIYQNQCGEQESLLFLILVSVFFGVLWN